MFDGVCDQTKRLQTLSGSMYDDTKWIISSSERYMFVRFAIETTVYHSTGFLAKIHYGNEILNQTLIQKGNNVALSTCLHVCKNR